MSSAFNRNLDSILNNFACMWQMPEIVCLELIVVIKEKAIKMKYFIETFHNFQTTYKQKKRTREYRKSFTHITRCPNRQRSHIAKVQTFLFRQQKRSYLLNYFRRKKNHSFIFLNVQFKRAKHDFKNTVSYFEMQSVTLYYTFFS